jgi:hypothetical protein
MNYKGKLDGWDDIEIGLTVNADKMRFELNIS